MYSIKHILLQYLYCAVTFHGYVYRGAKLKQRNTEVRINKIISGYNVNYIVQTATIWTTINSPMICM